MTTTATYKPNVLCSTAGMSEQEWLRWRTTGIGGSDAGTVLGANPYKTKRELYYEKRGVQPVKEKDEDTLPLRWGKALEQTVAEEFSIQTGLRVYEVKQMFQHPQYPFMLANVDRFIDLPRSVVSLRMPDGSCFIYDIAVYCYLCDLSCIDQYRFFLKTGVRLQGVCKP